MTETLNILIAIVDDNLEEAELIRHLLEDNEISNTNIFTDPEKFLEQPADEMHLCIVDYIFRNSGMNGFDIAKAIKRKNRRARIIIVTLYPDNEKLLDIINIGAWKGLNKSKPTFNQELVEYVKEGIELIKEDMQMWELLKQSMKRHE